MRTLSLTLSPRTPSRIATSLSPLFAQEEEKYTRRGRGELADRVESQEAVVIDPSRFLLPGAVSKSWGPKRIALISGSPKLKTLGPGALSVGRRYHPRAAASDSSCTPRGPGLGLSQ